MMERIDISDRLSVAKQPPSEADLASLARDGFKASVNLRTASEQNQPLEPDAEGSAVRALGMEYLHYPVSGDDLSAELVDEFRHRLDHLPRPVLAHCASGKRSGAFLMMHVAAKSGMSGEDTLRKAKEMGFECDQPGLEEFVRNYVDRAGGMA